MAAKKLETTYYRFMSEIRGFLSRLLKDPINAKPNKYLVDRNFNKTKTINVLIKREILERHEKILDSTNSDEKKAKYTIKYKVHKKGFEDKIHKIFNDYFGENNVNESSEMAMPLISRPSYQEVIGKKRKKVNEMRKIYITEAQFKNILECLVTPNAGDGLLNEDGEGSDGGSLYGVAAGATNSTQSGEVLTTKPKSVGPFADKGDGFFDGTVSKSAPINTRNMR